MKLASYLLPFLAVVQCGAFVVQTTPGVVSTALGMAAVELKEEPEGGREMTPKSSLPGARMKRMNALPTIASDEGRVFKFWMTAEANGDLIKGYRTQLQKDAAKKANFPGFRKGQIPPWAMPQITQFAVQESIIKTVEAAVEAFGLKSLPGNNGNVEVNEDVPSMAKGYKAGDALQFTATLNCALPRTAPAVDALMGETSDAVDVEVTAAAAVDALMEETSDAVDVEVTAVAEE